MKNLQTMRIRKMNKIVNPENSSIKRRTKKNRETDRITKTTVKNKTYKNLKITKYSVNQ